jgi:tmRNA-binding protein
MNHESLRTRKLLLHKRELEKLTAATQGKGTTLIPVRLYFRNGRVKCELAVVDATNLEPVTLADSDSAQVGDVVLAIGDPF